ncbi:class A sortase [Lysinibacillus contaminans]|uniref:class A sortase n=1 Tax=Lysinibacillus contaminans TaxID=1293441 RepID=UPI0009E8626E|nr:class A sortase [Lysinibacillus contaminans]
MNKFKNTLLICVLILGLILIFINPIQNFIIAHLSDRLNTTEYTSEDLQINLEKEADFDFEAVQSLSITEVLKAQASIDKLPVIGSIVIPEVQLQLPILKGVGQTALAVGAGTMKPTQQLGKGNYALASHYFEGKDILFGPLYRTKIGDAIYLTDLTNIYEYKLSVKKVIEATDVYVIEDTENTILTLITCTEDGEQRLMVQADFVKQYPMNEAPEELS